MKQNKTNTPNNLLGKNNQKEKGEGDTSIHPKGKTTMGGNKVMGKELKKGKGKWKGRDYVYGHIQKEWYIDVPHSGIGYLLSIVCGIPTIEFDNEKTLFYRLDDVIEWYEKEYKETGDKVCLFNLNEIKRDKVKLDKMNKGKLGSK
ncbi:MAG: hypothetical protein RBS43_08735 [Candidatus Cloacimonas sp.]|nr:hypothetical protein [Candidatus Cloacimonas sp.]